MIDLLQRLVSLPTAEPSAARTARIKRQAHAALRRQAARASHHEAPPTRAGAFTPIWIAAAACLGVAWLTEAVMLAARVLASR